MPQNACIDARSGDTPLNLKLDLLVDGELPVDQANQVLTDVFVELTDVLGNSETGRELRITSRTVQFS